MFAAPDKSYCGSDCVNTLCERNKSHIASTYAWYADYSPTCKEYTPPEPDTYEQQKDVK